MKDKILIVNGIESERATLVDALIEEGEILEAGDGATALKLIESRLEELGVILLKLTLPKMDGFKLIEKMKEKKLLGKVPIIIIERPTAVEVENQCFDMGIADFLEKPFSDRYIRNRVHTVMQNSLRESEFREKMDDQTKKMRLSFLALKQRTIELEQSKRDIIKILGAVVQYRDAEDKNNQHIKNIENMVEILGNEMMVLYPDCGLTNKKVKIISSTSALHDIGKIAIPDTILFKPGKLTDEEFEFMKSHTTKGCEILDQINDVWDKEYNDICHEVTRWHHEKYDGKGYPDGLAGDDIPLSAQLVSVAEIYDALISEKEYKKAFTKEQAYNMIINGESGIINPKILECFRRTKDKYEAATVRVTSDDSDE